MLEVRKYAKSELSAILGTNDKQGIDRKLQGYDVEFTSNGRGENRVYNIEKINNPFKVFCITELGVHANADFEKLRNLFYYLLCDEEFAELPMVEMEKVMAKNVSSSRQTISKWTSYLQKINYINIDKLNGICYAITKNSDGQKIYTKIEREVYNKAWTVYMEEKKKGNTKIAYQKAVEIAGGHPFKRPKISQNACLQKEIEQLIDMVSDAFLE